MTLLSEAGLLLCVELCCTISWLFFPWIAGLMVISSSGRDDLLMSEANKRAYAARRAAAA